MIKILPVVTTVLVVLSYLTMYSKTPLWGTIEKRLFYCPLTVCAFVHTTGGLFTHMLGICSYRRTHFLHIKMKLSCAIVITRLQSMVSLIMCYKSQCFTCISWISRNLEKSQVSEERLVWVEHYCFSPRGLRFCPSFEAFQILKMMGSNHQ